MTTSAPAPSETRNMILAVLVSAIILFAWQYFVETPKRQAQLADQQQAASQVKSQALPEVTSDATLRPVPTVDRTQAVAATPSAPRLPIQSDTLGGSLSLKGLRLDDLTLRKYRETVNPSSPPVEIFSPSNTATPHFVDFGWLAANLRVPDASSVWTADKPMLRVNDPVRLTWDNGQGLVFKAVVTLDEHYLFAVRQEIINAGAAPVQVSPFGLISKHWQAHTNMAVLHEGPLGVFDGTLTELTYEELQEDGKQTYEQSHGWLGFSDHYWLSALIPDAGQEYKGSFNSKPKGEDAARFQADYLGTPLTVAPGQTAGVTVRLFAGPKELSLLDHYEDTAKLPLFDRAVDFGVLYFLTRPMLLALDLFYHLIGNFGLAIMMLTIVVKALLFPLAYKSFKAIGKMKDIQPQMLALREKYGDDKMKMQQEIMALYKREKVNPAAGCLPVLVQITIFFALYKVLLVTIEMRHAPFFGWIQDLSAPDPTNLFTAFGLLPWNAPSFLHLGIWPLLMFITMVVQQQMSPKPTDPTQEKVMKLMPWIFLFLLASFPAGLVIYWTWSNALSIIQQLAITRRVEKKKARKLARA